MLPLIDTHCHLDFEPFHADLEAVLDRSIQSGIRKIINPGIDLTSSRAAIQISDEHQDFISAAVGVHPNDGNSWDNNTLDELKKMAKGSNVVAIGEIGLDYYRDRFPPTSQQTIFRQQLQLAGELSLPVIIHNRLATEDTLMIISEWIGQLEKAHSSLRSKPGVFHSFDGDLASAQRIISFGFLLGIGGLVTFNNAKPQQNLVAQLPLDRVILETDAPFLAPHPHRGQRNEPAFIVQVAEKVASLHNEPVADIAKITSRNAEFIFW